MGTSNFYTKNASKHYAVLMDYDEDQTICNDCNEVHYDNVSRCDSCDSKDLETKTITVSCEDFHKDDLIYYLHELMKDENMQCEDLYWSHQHDCSIFGYIDVLNTYDDVEVGFSLLLCLRYGYYEGATLDFVILDEEGHEYNDIDELLQDVEAAFDNSSMNEGLKVIHTNNAKKFINKYYQKTVDQVESIFTKASTPMITVAKFSNGVSMYQAV